MGETKFVQQASHCNVFELIFRDGNTCLVDSVPISTIPPRGTQPVLTVTVQPMVVSTPVQTVAAFIAGRTANGSVSFIGSIQSSATVASVPAGLWSQIAHYPTPDRTLETIR